MKIKLFGLLCMLVLLGGCSDYTSTQNISLATKEVCISHGRKTSTRPKMNTDGHYEYKCMTLEEHYENTGRVIIIN